MDESTARTSGGPPTDNEIAVGDVERTAPDGLPTTGDREDTEAAEAPMPPPETMPDARQQRTVGDLMRPRLSRGQILTAALCAALGFAAMVQVRQPEDEVLQRARRADLVQILDGLTQRTDRLSAEIAELETTKRELLSSADRQETALEQSRARARRLAVLAGTSPAKGPGILLTIHDGDGEITSAVLLSAVQELRDAGAEAIQIEGRGDVAVRVVASTYFLDASDGSIIDGVRVEPPYRILAIGDPAMERALAIPGGVIEAVTSKGGIADVEKVEEMEIDTLHSTTEPKYARPVPPKSAGS